MNRALGREELNVKQLNKSKNRPTDRVKESNWNILAMKHNANKQAKRGYAALFTSLSH